MISTIFNSDILGGGWQVKDGDLSGENPLFSRVINALFTDRRVGIDEANGGSRRGWLGDAVRTDGKKVGSKLWLLGNRKLVPETIGLAIAWVEEALTFLTESGIASSVRVEAEAG
jgi:phage gp46-like protein